MPNCNLTKRQLQMLFDVSKALEAKEMKPELTYLDSSEKFVIAKLPPAVRTGSWADANPADFAAFESCGVFSRIFGRENGFYILEGELNAILKSNNYL